jgi:hypothetical protein
MIRSMVGSLARLRKRVTLNVKGKKEKRIPLHGTVLLEVLLEEAGSLHVDTHGSEHDGEVIFVTIHDTLALLDETSLTANLGSNLVQLKQQKQQQTSLWGRPAAEKMGIF